MTNQLKSDHYIYFLYDKHDVVRYVGHGRRDRWKEASKKRSDEYNTILQDGGKVEIVKDNLTKLQAVAAENEYLTKYVNVTVDNFNLINKSSTSRLVTLTYEFISSVFKLDYNSPTFLVWVEDSPRGYGARSPKAGQAVGSLSNKSKYAQTSYKKKHYLIHRLIWVLHNKQDLEPHFVINHIDSNTKNNHPSNLERTSQRDNVLKSKIQPTVTGVRGVSFNKNKRTGAEIYIACIADSDQNKLAKTFAIKKYGKDEALRLAIEWREFMVDFIHKQNKSIKDLPDEYRTPSSKKRDTNVPVGVALIINNNRQVFKCTFTKGDIKLIATFPVLKYGYDEAFRLACEWRKRMEDLHYNK